MLEDHATCHEKLKCLFTMNLVQEIKERHQQFAILHNAIESDYANLKIAYDKQHIDLVEYKHQAHYWEAQFGRLKTREKALQSELEEAYAKLRKREHQLFGRRSEKNTKKLNTNPASTLSIEAKKKRGQQPGSKGHGRRDHSHLPQIEETHELPSDERNCPCCGLILEELAGTEDSRVIEIINVKAYQRVIHRKRYKRTCECEPSTPKILSAPNCTKLLSKSTYGVSVWSYILLQKYAYHLPVNRILQQLSAIELSLAAGTIIDGLQKLIPFLSPVYDAIIGRSLSASHWHADETGWKVFEAIEGKKNNRWYMWIFYNDETVVYKICPSRSSKVLIEHFGDSHPGGTLNVDRYSAYKAIAKAGLFILAFCWAHVRRDFLEHAKGYPEQEAWGLDWVEKIAKLYHINNQRIEFNKKSKTYRKHHKALVKQIDYMREAIDAQLKDDMLLPSAKKVLKSLDNHWDGLTVFVDEPSIPMDNNIAERGLRGPIIGRNGYYGSGAVWSSVLSAMMFTISKTLQLSQLNLHTWLLAYLQECAMSGGIPPDNIDKFLPWNMTGKQKRLFADSIDSEKAL